MNTSTKPPRLAPSPSSTAARAFAAPANLASRTLTIEAMSFYAKVRGLDDEIDAWTTANVSTRLESALACRRHTWVSVVSLAAMALAQEPETEADVLLQIGLAASWLDAVADQMDAEANLHTLAKVMARALSHITVRMSSAVPSDALSPDIAELAQHFVDEAAKHIDPANAAVAFS